MGQPLNTLYNPIRNQNPMLMPNFDPILSAASDGIEHFPVDQFLIKNPRTASAGQVTIGGTVATGHTITLNFANNVFPSSTNYQQKVTVAVTYLTTGSDTASTVAAQLALAINANVTLQQFGFYATADEAAGQINIFQQSAVGSFTTLSGSSTGAETVTVNTQITGGSGPVIPVYAFEFSLGTGQVLNFYANRPVIASYNVLNALVTQGYPIY